MQARFSLDRPLAILLLALSVTPAGAITNGVPDVLSPHANVGFIAIKFWGSEELFLWCSGALIAPELFLTASHCTLDLDAWLAAGYIEAIYVSFDPAHRPTIDQLDLAFQVDRIVTNPRYTLRHRSDDGDIALLILKQRVTDSAPWIRPARLPAAGLLDDLRAQAGLRDQRFTAVGYGATTVVPGRAFSLGAGVRQVASSEYRALAPGYLHLSQNPSVGDGGTCYGDSGGPNFLGDTDVIAAVTVTGDSVCRATNVDYRLDTDSARQFLGGYLELP